MLQKMLFYGKIKKGSIVPIKIKGERKYERLI